MKMTSSFKWVLALIVSTFVGYQSWLGSQIISIKTGQATLIERTKSLDHVDDNANDISLLELKVAVIEEKIK